jgi:hypothetical protein
MQLALAGWAWGFFSTERRRSFYAKHCPLWGGITNLNLNALWPLATREGPVDYLRGVSTGPVTPLVLSATTAGDHINIGLTYRLTVFSIEEIGAVQARLLDFVHGPEAHA